MAEDFGVHLDVNQIQRAGSKAIGQKEDIRQESAENSIKYMGDNALFVNIRRNFDTLENTLKKREVKEKKTEEGEEVVAVQEVQGVEETAEQFQKKNPELQTKSLLYLRDRISPNDSQEEILDKLQEAYPDPFLANDALDFLIATSSGELTNKLVEAKKKFTELYGREIIAGRNVSIQSREFSKLGLGSPTGLRDLYKDITQNPREASTLFAELTENYTFEKLTTVIAFILHSLGSDLKAKGSSIEKGELVNLLTEAKSMQAILGVYRFFKSRMRLILSSFERDDLELPSRVNFESLSKLFVKLLLERFPSADKVFQIGIQMGLDDHLLAELIIFSQMRDAIRQVSPRLFKSEQHRQETLTIFLEVLEKIEDDLDAADDDDDGEKNE